MADDKQREQVDITKEWRATHDQQSAAKRLRLFALLAGISSLAGLLFFVPPFHMYRHLKQAYGLGRWSAIMRTMALVTFAFIAASLFMVTAVAIGALD